MKCIRQTSYKGFGEGAYILIISNLTNNSLERKKKCTNEHFERGRVQCMIFFISLIPMSKIAAAYCARLLPVISREWV